LLAIRNAANGIVLIDEIENGLHYSSQQHVWESIAHAAQQFNVQVFATTHSREMIEAAYRAFPDSDTFRYHRLDRDEASGEVRAVSYSPDLIEAALEMDFEVRG
jgi:AAA15 family ATPase/GTPase